MAQAKKTKTKPAAPKESSSEFFARNRPKFLDWAPLTPDEVLLAAQTRSEEREAQLRKVIELEKAKQKKKASEKKISGR